MAGRWGQIARCLGWEGQLVGQARGANPIGEGGRWGKGVHKVCSAGVPAPLRASGAATEARARGRRRGRPCVAGAAV
jgi:hypothetical protein